MADKIREIQSKIMDQFQGEGGSVLAAFSYFPFFGWLYPYFFRKEDELCSFHGAQAMRLNLAVVVLYSSIWVIENFPITSIFFGQDEILHPLSRALWLVTLFLYFGFSAVGAYKAFSGNIWEIPYLKEVTEKVVTYIKSLRKSS